MNSPLFMPPLFILELANNHMGDLSHGIRVIREMREACAGFEFRFALKLQYRSLPELIHPDFRDRRDMKLIKRFSETALAWDDLRRLKDAIVEHGFLAICTPSDEGAVDRIVEQGFDFLKVASCALTDWPLAEKIAATDLPVILSTAGESFEDIDRVVSFYQHRKKTISILHCVGEYPTTAHALQLNQIDLLRRRYAGIEVGYSTHESPDEFQAVMMAVAKGATIFEKHVGVATESYPLNAYSASPQQVRQWLRAAGEAFAMAGSEGQRHRISEKERQTLSELRRGVFARRSIPNDAVIGPDDFFLAMPAMPGQLVANDLSKYSQYRTIRSFSPREAILAAGVVATDTRSLVNGVVRDVKALLKTSGAIVPAQLELELSHHYGLARFREVGSAMITVINREYCKRLLLLLPGQRHPEHWHTIKDETFHLLHGEIELVLEGVCRHCVTNDVVVIPCGAKHEFWSASGAVIEEISSTHTKNDSGYTDVSVTENPDRKTYITNWMD